MRHLFGQNLNSFNGMPVVHGNRGNDRDHRLSTCPGSIGHAERQPTGLVHS
jgi:hypothetical protein